MPQGILESQNESVCSNFITSKKDKSSSNHQNKTNDTQREEEPQRNICVGSFKRSSSSPALSLLLRSTIFKELVEKNSSASDDENAVDEDGRIFYDGTGRIPLAFSSESDDLVLDNHFFSSFYNRSGLSL